MLQLRNNGSCQTGWRGSGLSTDAACDNTRLVLMKPLGETAPRISLG